MSGAEDVQVVTFGLGDEVFAVPVMMICEILDYAPAFRVPKGPAWLLGLTDLRGKGVPLVDLRVRLGLPRSAITTTTRALVSQIDVGDRQVTLALVVDRVLGVSNFATTEIETAPDLGIRWDSEYIQGVVRRAGEFVLLLDICKVFSEQDMDDRSLTLAAA